MASSPGEDMGSLDDGQAYNSEADLNQQPSSRVSAVLTCSGNLTDPDFNEKCTALFDRLQNVLRNDEISVVKCEPWNSVKITFDLPTEAAQRLSELAELARRGDDNTLRQLGILSLQLQGGQIISMTLADGNSSSSSAATNSRTTPSASTSRLDSSAESRDVTSAVASRLPSSTAISVVSSRTGASSPHLLSPSSSSPSSSSSSPKLHSATASSLLDRAGSQMKRSSSGMMANSVNQRSSSKTNRSAGGTSTNSSLLVNLLQKDAGSTEMDSSPPEKKRRKYSSQGGARDMDSSPSVTKVANAMMAGHHSANGPTGFSESERLLAERLASAASAGTTLIPPKSEGLSSGKDRVKGSHNQYGKKQTDIDAVSSSPKGSNNKSASVSRTGNSHLNTQIHSESSIQHSVSDSKKDVKSAISGRSTSLLNSMMPPPKSKNSASNSSTSLSNLISPETNSSATIVHSSDKQQRVQHPAIVGGGVGRDNQVQPQPLRNATDLLENKRDLQIQNRAAAVPKSRQILINPNTGMLESGPSESSSEGENDLDGSGAYAAAHSDKRKSVGVLNTIASGLVRNQSASTLTTNAERALKVKLRLPSTPQQTQQQAETPEGGEEEFSQMDPDIQPIKMTKIEPPKSSISADDASSSFPSSPITDQSLSTIGSTPINPIATSASTSINNNNHKFIEQNNEKLDNFKKHYQHQGSGENYQDNGNFSDYALLRKLFPHHDKTILLDALLSCDGSTVAAIQHLLTHNVGRKSNIPQRSHHGMKPDRTMNVDDSPNHGVSSFSKRMQKSASPMSSPPLNFNIQKRSASRRKSLEATTPPPPPSLGIHGNNSNQIPDLSSPVLHHGSPTHPMSHSHSNPNFNFPSSKFSSYAAAQAQQFYAHAHQRYLAAAAAAAASALQQGHPHGMGHQMTNSQNPLAVPTNIASIGQGGFFSGNILSRPDFAQYLSNAAAAQHHIPSTGRVGSTNIGIGSSNSNHSTLVNPNLLLNPSSGIPPLFQTSSTSGPSIRGDNAAAAAAAAMAAATNKFFRQQVNNQIVSDEKPSNIASPVSPMISEYSSLHEPQNDGEKIAARNSTTTPSLESCGGDESTYPCKIAHVESNGQASNDIESNCSAANSND